MISWISNTQILCSTYFFVMDELENDTQLNPAVLTACAVVFGELESLTSGAERMSRVAEEKVSEGTGDSQDCIRINLDDEKRKIGEILCKFSTQEKRIKVFSSKVAELHEMKSTKLHLERLAQILRLLNETKDFLSNDSIFAASRLLHEVCLLWKNIGVSQFGADKIINWIEHTIRSVRQNILQALTMELETWIRYQRQEEERIGVDVFGSIRESISQATENSMVTNAGGRNNKAHCTQNILIARNSLRSAFRKCFLFEDCYELLDARSQLIEYVRMSEREYAELVCSTITKEFSTDPEKCCQKLFGLLFRLQCWTQKGFRFSPIDLSLFYFIFELAVLQLEITVNLILRSQTKRELLEDALKSAHIFVKSLDLFIASTPNMIIRTIFFKLEDHVLAVLSQELLEKIQSILEVDNSVFFAPFHVKSPAEFETNIAESFLNQHPLYPALSFKSQESTTENCSDVVRDGLMPFSEHVAMIGLRLLKFLSDVKPLLQWNIDSVLNLRKYIANIFRIILRELHKKYRKVDTTEPTLHALLSINTSFYLLLLGGVEFYLMRIIHPNKDQSPCLLAPGPLLSDEFHLLHTAAKTFQNRALESIKSKLVKRPSTGSVSPLRWLKEKTGNTLQRKSVLEKLEASLSPIIHRIGDRAIVSEMRSECLSLIDSIYSADIDVKP